RCNPAGGMLITRCFAGRRDTQVCAPGSTCTQPTELSYQAHCGNGSYSSVTHTCPSDIDSAARCETELDPLTDEPRPVLKWGDDGQLEPEYCVSGCGLDDYGYAECN